MGGLHRQTVRSASANDGGKRGRGPSIFSLRVRAPSPSRTPPPRQHGNLLPRAEFPPRNARDRRVGVGTLLQGCPRASSRVNPRRASPRPRPSAGAFRFFFGTRESSRVAMREKKDVEVLRLRAAPPISRRSYPPKTDQITSDTRRVNQTASNPAPSGVQPATQARRTRRDPRLTPGFGHPNGENSNLGLPSPSHQPASCVFFTLNGSSNGRARRGVRDRAWRVRARIGHPRPLSQPRARPSSRPSSTRAQLTPPRLLPLPSMYRDRKTTLLFARGAGSVNPQLSPRIQTNTTTSFKNKNNFFRCSASSNPGHRRRPR